MADETTESTETTEASEATEQTQTTESAQETTDFAWPDDWRTRLANGNEDVAKRLDRFNAPADLASAYVDANAAISSGKFGDKIAVPGDDASDEDWATFTANLPERLRPPEKPEDYQIAHPEWVTADDSPVPLEGPVQERIDGFTKAMHEVGAPQAVVQTALNAYWGMVETDLAEQRAADERYVKDTEADLRKEWGGDYDKNLEVANRAIEHFFGRDSEIAGLQIKDGPLLGSLPEFSRAMAKVGRMIGEDEMVSGLRDDSARQSLQEQIDAIQEQGYKDGNYWSEAVQSKLRPLYDQLHGTAPADGRAAA